MCNCFKPYIMIKKILFLFVISLMSFSTIGEEPVERIGLKGPLVFDKTNFSLAWTAHPNENYYVQEYLPKNETVEHFNQLLTVHVFTMDVSVDSAVEQKVKELNKRKETDKVCNFSIMKSPDGKESIIDCLLSSGSNDKVDIVEFIIYRYKQIELKNNKKALLIYAYSKRSYDDKITPFFKNLQTDRPELLSMMTSTQMPTILIKE